MTTYVALGSSFAAGPGIAPVVHRGALRSGRNYPHQVAEQLSMRLIDVTCTGAKTVDILNAPQRTLRGRMGPQIDVVTPDAGLVTITVGGNDLDYLGTLTKGSLVNAAAKRLGFLPRNVTDPFVARSTTRPLLSGSTLWPPLSLRSCARCGSEHHVLK